MYRAIMEASRWSCKCVTWKIECIRKFHTYSSWGVTMHLINFPCLLIQLYISLHVLTHLNKIELLNAKTDIWLRQLTPCCFVIMFPLIFGDMLLFVLVILLVECHLLFGNIKIFIPSFFLSNLYFIFLYSVSILIWIYVQSLISLLKGKD